MGKGQEDVEGYKYQSEIASPSLPIHLDDYLLPFAYSALI